MFNTKQELLAAIRMLLSKEQLVTLSEVISKPSPENNYVMEFDEFLTISKKALRSQVTDWFAKNNNLPDFVLLEGVGAFAVSSTAHRNNHYSKRMENKVVIVTGGAQGFGAGLARSFYREGANVVIADLNAEAGTRFTDDLNEEEFPNRAIFVHSDVSDFGSVEQLIGKTILSFGGLDVMISNAGILHAGGLEEMSPEKFSLITKINYEGYFNSAKAASPIMKLQAEFTDKFYFDILQINSKSGLKGSNKNFAYAGGKFGGIGLTQSFALELMSHRIKVNSICPGNFFDGPLWSHPETGLFVQYLNAGKVPGAKTIDDVKRFYEQQVPAGRGCETEDVAKAAFYAIEQEYETGQAIPVTGGQIMLH